MWENALPAIGLFALASSACADRITTPEIVEHFERWDAAQLRSSADLFAMHWSSGTSFDRLPRGARVVVRDGAQEVSYQAVVVENRFRGATLRGEDCISSDYLAVMMWRQRDDRPGLDVLVATIGVTEGVMVGRVQRPKVSSCGLGPSPTVGSYQIAAGSVPPNGWYGSGGTLRVHRRTDGGECAFIADAAGLAREGITCRSPRYDVSLNVILSPGDTLIQGARAVTLGARDIPGALFTVDCPASQRRFARCG
ncbi:MAG TPA: hypothetical protein VLB00_07360 [Gemmatimonadales bacterium]|nr:hypothetical protein [Gemmatimonadales bacterium]